MITDTKELLELELENLRLRAALETIANMKDENYYKVRPEQSAMDSHHIAIGGVSAAPSTEAITALVEKVEKMTLERCADFVKQQRNDIPACGFEFSSAIRALPTGTIKLEDLL